MERQTNICNQIPDSTVSVVPEVPIYESPSLVYDSPKLQRNSLYAAAQVVVPPAEATPDVHYTAVAD